MALRTMFFVLLLLWADVGLLFGQGGGQTLAPVPAKVYQYGWAGKAVPEDVIDRHRCARALDAGLGAPCLRHEGDGPCR